MVKLRMNQAILVATLAVVLLVPRSEKHLVFFPAFGELGVAMPVAPRDVRQVARRLCS